MTEPTNQAADANTDPPQPGQWVRFAGLCVFAYVVMITYALARPATESLFLSKYTYKQLPYAWILVAVVAFLVVGLYNRFATRTDLVRLCGAVCALSALVLALLLLAVQANIPGAVYLLYAWKDVYIVVLVEIFWSFANIVYPIKTARWAYGIFSLMGSLGGLTGNVTIGKLAKAYGTSNALWLLVPMLPLIGLGCFFFARIAGVSAPKAASKDAPPPSFGQGFKIVKQSRYLVLMLLLVATTQIAITFIDFQTNKLIQTTYTQIDQRTAIIGYIYGSISIGAIVLQALTGPILRLAGIPLTLLAIPLLLGLSVMSFAFFQRFLTIAAAKVSSKVLDYSLFRSAKEILYIPLQYDEKTQGKAVVDMLTYRVSKGAASLILLLLSFIHLLPILSWLTIALLTFWFTITLLLTRLYKQNTTD